MTPWSSNTLITKHLKKLDESKQYKDRNNLFSTKSSLSVNIPQYSLKAPSKSKTLVKTKSKDAFLKNQMQLNTLLPNRGNLMLRKPETTKNSRASLQ